MPSGLLLGDVFSSGKHQPFPVITAVGVQAVLECRANVLLVVRTAELYQLLQFGAVLFDMWVGRHEWIISHGTPCPELLALLPWERLGEPRNPRTQQSQYPGKPSCDIPAGTPDNRGPWGLPEALNRGLEASIKRPPGLVENRPFQGFWGVGPWGGCFQLRSMSL